MIPPTPLDRLTGRRVASVRQWEARLAICRYVRSHGLGRVDIGPRYRRGSNAWRDNVSEQIINPDLPSAACPECGADGDDLFAVDGVVFCPACRSEWRVGDYDWTSLADCLRYRNDLAAGQVETDDYIVCEACRRPIGAIYARYLATGHVECDRPACRLKPANAAETPQEAPTERFQG